MNTRSTVPSNSLKYQIGGPSVRHSPVVSTNRSVPVYIRNQATRIILGTRPMSNSPIFPRVEEMGHGQDRQSGDDLSACRDAIIKGLGDTNA